MSTSEYSFELRVNTSSLSPLPPLNLLCQRMSLKSYIFLPFTDHLKDKLALLVIRRQDVSSSYVARLRLAKHRVMMSPWQDFDDVFSLSSYMWTSKWWSKSSRTLESSMHNVAVVELPLKRFTFRYSSSQWSNNSIMKLTRPLLFKMSSSCQSRKRCYLT